MNILFDLDGTLTDSYEGITRSITHALTVVGRTPPPRESLTWCIGPPLRNSFRILLDSTEDELVDETLFAYRERFRSIGIFENRVYDGVPEMLESLQQKDCTLYVATSKPTVFAGQIIDHFGLRDRFKTVYGSELTGERGEKTSLIAHILASEGCAPSETTMVGDRAYDMIGSCANGLQGLGVLWGYGSIEELQEAGASACLQRPPELIDLFEQLCSKG